jgi:prophage regulatory protein
MNDIGPFRAGDNDMGTSQRDQLIGLRDVVTAVGLSRATVYRYVRRDDPKRRFPAPVRIGARSLWLEREVQEWIARQVAASRVA